MTPLQLTLPLPASSPAILTLPQPPTTALLSALEQTFSHTLKSLRRELTGGETEAGDIEYASWLQA
ncbi:MAG TPA: hypothetical protein VFY22_09860 [Hydrogenophaga sp.]|nr:hypothetical protein [Hydrogenophaga sp.]